MLIHDSDDYREKCFDNGVEPHPNNLLQFIIDYVVENAPVVQVKKLKCNFPNEVWEYRGYYFQIIQGQGAIVKIINKDDMRELLVI